MWNSFLDWLKKHQTFHSGLTAALFLTQIVHLYWLFTYIVLFRLTGVSYFNPSPFFNTALALADYTEIPALISGTLFYLSQLKGGLKTKSLLFIFLLNSQWLHLLWITDEVIYDQFTGHTAILIPIWLSWIAISFDYFEVPVIIDTTKHFFQSLKRRSGKIVLNG